MKIDVDDEMHLTLVDSKHAPELLALINRNRPYLRQWLGWLDMTRTIPDLENFIGSCVKEFEAKKGLSAFIWSHGTIVGIMHLKEVDHTNQKAMIGYWVGEEYRGKGLAKKACRAVINLAFKQWNLNRLEVRCAVENTASQSIPINLGFKKEGILRENEWLYDHFVDHSVFSMLKKDWVIET